MYRSMRTVGSEANYRSCTHVPGCCIRAAECATRRTRCTRPVCSFLCMSVVREKQCEDARSCERDEGYDRCPTALTPWQLDTLSPIMGIQEYLCVSDVWSTGSRALHHVRENVRKLRGEPRVVEGRFSTESVFQTPRRARCVSRALRRAGLHEAVVQCVGESATASHSPP